MPQVKRDEIREERISMEAVVEGLFSEKSNKQPKHQNVSLSSKPL